MRALAQQFLARRKPVDDDRLLRLFWNRAELKREFGRLQREREKLLDQLRAQETAVLRFQQRLDQLEDLLADPERAASAAVHFQLRGVSAHCRRRLLRLARDLTARQLEREGLRESARFEENRQAALTAIEQRLQPLQERRAALEAELAAVCARLEGRRGFWHILARRRLEAERARLAAAEASVGEQIARYGRARQDKLRDQPTNPEGISVEGKRQVNLSLIALAQELMVAFSEQRIAMLAREASLRDVGEFSYGRLEACRQLSAVIDQVLHRVEKLDRLPFLTSRRAEYLRLQVHYRQDGDTIPAPDSLAVIPLEMAAKGPPRPAGPGELVVNVLAEEYWDLYSVLLH